MKNILQRTRCLIYIALYAPQSLLRDTKRWAEITAMPDDKNKYDALHAFLRSKVMLNGFDIYNKDLNWQDEFEFWDIWKKFPLYKKSVADRKFVVWSLARSTKNIPGDTVECGVFAGASSYLICSIYKNVENEHHAFDSFEGLSDPSREDVPVSQFATGWVEGDLTSSQDVILSNLQEFKDVYYYKGWIPSRFKEVTHKKFSFVHIDVDLYQPTKDSLEFFYPRLNAGGILLCDDYGSHRCPGARKAFDEFVKKIPEQSVVHLPTGQGFIVKRSEVKVT